MELTKSSINKRVAFTGFDGKVHDAHIDHIRFADQINSTMVRLCYFEPTSRYYITANLTRKEFAHRVQDWQLITSSSFRQFPS